MQPNYCSDDALSLVLKAAKPWESSLREVVLQVQLEVPIIPGVGVCTRATASGMIYNGGICSDLYTASAGAYWNLPFARILEFQTKVMAGWARMHHASGVDLSGGVSLSLITDNNFKIKMFGEFDSISISKQEPWINTFIAGFSTGFFW